MGSCANTILLNFNVDPSCLVDEGLPKLEKGIVDALESVIGANSLAKLVEKVMSPYGDNLSVYLGPQQSVINLRTFPSGLVTINIDYFLEQDAKPLLTREQCQGLESFWRALATTSKCEVLPAIKRGMPLDTYFVTSDGRLTEYDIDGVVHDEKTAHQHVQILHSKTFGNMLVLDGLPNLAESDLIYTESLMRRGFESYKGKTILILGGGDGALLNELLKEQPAEVTMVEIDEVVMQICKRYLRSACGSSLDSYLGNNYNIIVGDCVAYLEKCVQTGKTFDYVFADLTDIPISSTPQGEIWNFIKTILSKSFAVLNASGKYMTHGTGISNQKALEMFEGVLDQLEIPVKFTRTHAFVPSFLEDWVFYDIKREKKL